MWQQAELRFSCVVPFGATHFLFSRKGVVKKIIEKEMYGKMEKAVYFSEKDRALIEQIEAYQKEQDISFDVAVKQLCENALTQKNGLEWGTFDK